MPKNQMIRVRPIPGLTPLEVEDSVQLSIARLHAYGSRVESLVSALWALKDRALAGVADAGDVQQLRSLRDQLVQLIAPLSACGKGCSHCCKMAVTITSDEAAALGKEIGVTPKNPGPDWDRESMVSRYMNTVCPFLKNGVCQIYEHRPSACRTHFNVSAFPVLCDTINYPGHEVPNFDFRVFWAASAALALAHGGYPADIRDFFP